MELEAGVLWHSRPARRLCLYLGKGLMFCVVAGGVFGWYLSRRSFRGTTAFYFARF
jgi:hypothetical protein